MTLAVASPEAIEADRLLGGHVASPPQRMHGSKGRLDLFRQGQKARGQSCIVIGVWRDASHDPTLSETIHQVVRLHTLHVETHDSCRQLA